MRNYPNALKRKLLEIISQLREELPRYTQDSNRDFTRKRKSANMELVMPRFADSVSAGETVPVFFQVMNMGRSAMYNVRCVVSGYGLVPSNTGYIGTMEAGTSKTAKVVLYIIALNASEGNENRPQYGDTTGTVTLIYEDETGQEYSQEAAFDTTVNRPVVQLPQNNSEEEKKSSALVFGGYPFLFCLRNLRGWIGTAGDLYELSSSCTEAFKRGKY